MESDSGFSLKETEMLVLMQIRIGSWYFEYRLPGTDILDQLYHPLHSHSVEALYVKN